MASEVLQKTRKINKTLQTSGGSNVSFDLLAGALGEVLSSNVYVLSSKGKVLGLHLNDIADSSVVEDDITKQKKFPEEYNTNVLKIKDNKIYAIGVGKATIIANLDSKEESFDYNIVAKLKSISTNKNIELEIGETKNVQANVVTSPKGLKTPKIKYAFAESKLPVQRKISLDANGKIVGLRKGKEKLLISCGTGKNKVQKYVYVTVKESTIENKMVDEFYLNYYFIEEDLILNLKWKEMYGVEGYKIYLKDNNLENSDYNLIKTIDKDDITKKDANINEIIKLESKKYEKFNYDIYVVGYNRQQNSLKSRVYKVENDL